MRESSAEDPGLLSREYFMMVEMGWSWRDLCDTPFFVIDEIYTRLQSKQKWTKTRQDLDKQMSK